MKTKQFGDIRVTSAQMEEAIRANADGKEAYFGIKDPMVDFGQAKSFIDEEDALRELTFKFVNNTGATQKIQFNPVLSAIDGYTVISEGNVITDSTGSTPVYLTANGEPVSINKYLEYMKHCCIRVRKIKVDVSSEAQLSEYIKYYKSNLFESDATLSQVRPSNYQDQSTQNTKTVTIDVDYTLSHRHTILYSIRAAQEVTFTLFFGAAMDMDKALEAKANLAAANAAAILSQRA